MGYGMLTGLKQGLGKGEGPASGPRREGGGSRQPKGPDHTAATIRSYDNGVIMISKH
jgi:hypothetical protein